MNTEYQLDELSIEVTNKCNCRCIMCSSGSTMNKMPNELSRDEIFSLIWQGSELGAKVLSLSGGDPATDIENVTDYIRYAASLNYERILLYTTGITLSRNYVNTNHYPSEDNVRAGGVLSDELGELTDIPNKGKITLIYSLHSNIAHVHDYITGVSESYAYTLLSMERAHLRGFNVEVHMVPMLPNWNHVEGMIHLCEDRGIVSKLSLLRFVPQTRGRQNNRVLGLNALEFSQLNIRIHNILESRAPEQMPVVRIGCPMDFRHVVFPQMTEKQHQCHAGKDLILVRPEGDVHPCAAWKTLPDTDNVRNMSLEEIWNDSEIFNELREYHEHGWNMVGGKCHDCRYNPTCKSGCIAQRLHQIAITTGRIPDIHDIYEPIPDPLCIIGTRK